MDTKKEVRKMKMTIGKKIALVIGSMLLLIVVSGILAVVNIEKVGRNADVIMDEAKIIDSIQEVRVSVQQLLMPPNDYLIRGGEDEKENFENLLKVTRRKLSKCSDSVLNHEHYTKHDVDDKAIIEEIESNLLKINNLGQEILSTPGASVLKYGQIMEEMDSTAYKTVMELDELISISRMAGKHDLTDSIQELKLAFHRLLMPTNDYLITADPAEKDSFTDRLVTTREKFDNFSSLLTNYKGQIERPGEKLIIDSINKDLERIVSLANRILSIPNPTRVPDSEKMRKLDTIGDQATEMLGKLVASAHESGRHELADSAQNLRIAFQQLLMPVNDYMIHKDQTEKKIFQKSLALAQENLTSLSNAVSSGKEREIINRIEEDLTKVVSLSREVLTASDPTGHNGVELMEEMDGIADHITADLHVLLNDAEEDIQQAMIIADRVESVSKSFNIAAIFVLIAVGLGTGAFVSLPIIKSIHSLVVGTKMVGDGDLGYHVSVKTNDELAGLADSFNQMTHQIQKRNEELETMNEELNSSNEELEASNEELQSTTEELEASNEELRTTTEELQESNDEVKKLNENLEDKVQERTEELMAANEELRTTNEELSNTQDKLVQQEKLAAIGQLASGVGHELRNPLGVIKNAAYYIKTKVGSDDPKLVKHLTIMDREIRNSNRIISDLLGFSRTRLPSVAPSDPNRMVEDAMEVIEMPEDVLLVKELDTALPNVMTDADQIHQVLVNLALNAVQAMTEGGQLKVKTRSAGDYVEIEVSDTGCGIPLENLKKLFDPFFSTKARGVGLGLAVTHGIVERNQGKIDVESKVGEGTTFTVKLPVVKEASENEATEPKKVVVG